MATYAIANIIIRPFAEYEACLLGHMATTTYFLSLAATDAGSDCELLMGLDQLLSPFIRECFQVGFNAPSYRNCAHLGDRLRPRNRTPCMEVLVVIPKETLIWVVDLEFIDADNPWNRLV
jgi:putative hemolysin